MSMLACVAAAAAAFVLLQFQEDARYWLATDAEGRLVGYTHFRYTIDLPVTAAAQFGQQQHP
jgi:hypothetical protein